ncbi:hypothetical protein SteCoe_28860 [Stentor coeruleus]|uniref:Uncharacterized protein n=1 Tax=Stentor coeruleus TaxID=5963 RepID=A0A1R2B7K0_9CILI|nr:hypothetical protein SteCoe_28860 [Stentor coeruleus]
MYFQLKKVPDYVVENKIDQLEKQGIFLYNHCSSISCAVVSDDLKYLITGSGTSCDIDDFSIHIWDLITSQQVFSLRHLPKSVTRISISPDNSSILITLKSTSLYYTELWSSSSIKNLLESQSLIILTSMISNNHGLFFTQQKKLSLINFYTRELLLIISYENEKNIGCMALKNNFFAFGTNTGVLNVCLYENVFLNKPFVVSKGRIKDMNFDNEGKFLIFTALNTKGERRIFIWDIELNKIFRKIKIGEFNAMKICYSYQLNILVTNNYNTFRVWNLNNEEGFKTLNFDLAREFFLVKCFLVVIMTGVYNYKNKNKIAVYNIQNMQDWYIFNGHIGIITCIKIDKAKNVLVSGSLDGQIILWDLKSKKVIRKFIDQTDGVISLDFDENHVYVVSGSIEKSCHIWDFNTGNIIEIIRENPGWVTDVKIYPNLQFIAFACCLNNEINVYDIKKKKKKTMKLIDSYFIMSIAFLNNCKYAVVNGIRSEISKILILKL